MRSWAVFHPDFEVRVVTRADLSTLFPGRFTQGQQVFEKYPWVDSLTRESDLVRLLLLEKFGGVWMDATFLLAEPLHYFNEVLTPVGPDMAGYYLQAFTTRQDSPVIESWTFAARPGALFFRAWLLEFLSIPGVQNGVQAKLDAYIAGGVDIQKIDMPHYLLIHVAAQHLLQFRCDLVSMVLFPAETGPYRNLSESKWDIALAVKSFVASYPRAGGVFKLRGCDRPIITDDDLQNIERALG